MSPSPAVFVAVRALYLLTRSMLIMASGPCLQSSAAPFGAAVAAAVLATSRGLRRCQRGSSTPRAPGAVRTFALLGCSCRPRPTAGRRLCGAPVSAYRDGGPQGRLPEVAASARRKGGPYVQTAAMQSASPPRPADTLATLLHTYVYPPRPASSSRPPVEARPRSVLRTAGK